MKYAKDATVRVAFGTTVLEKGSKNSGIDGIGGYTRELMHELNRRSDISLNPFFFQSVNTNKNNSVGLSVGRFKTQAFYSLLTGLSFPVTSRVFAEKFDVIHATDHLIPRVRDIPVVATLMDAIPLSHPQWISRNYLKTLRNSMWKCSAQWATHVITISEYSKAELIKWFGLCDECISVVPLGVDRRWFVEPTTAEIERVQVQYTLPEQFFLFMGTLQPRKNLQRLIEAHKGLPAAIRAKAPLVVVGRRGWGCEDEVQLLEEGDQNTLRWLKYVPDEDIIPILRQATALVHPSLYEGFGLTILEAFAAGVPVITSNLTSLPEVAGGAAMLVDPYSNNSIGEAMYDLVEDFSLKNQLIEDGRKRAEFFTWEKTSALTAAVYRKVLT